MLFHCLNRTFGLNFSDDEFLKFLPHMKFYCIPIIDEYLDCIRERKCGELYHFFSQLSCANSSPDDDK